MQAMVDSWVSGARYTTPAAFPTASASGCIALDDRFIAGYRAALPACLSRRSYRISPSQKGEGADQVHNAGIPTYIDRKPKIAHNKVMVIDGATVITGSFNFSANAECCNAENLLVIHRPELAADSAGTSRGAKRSASSI